MPHQDPVNGDSPLRTVPWPSLDVGRQEFDVHSPRTTWTSNACSALLSLLSFARRTPWALPPLWGAPALSPVDPARAEHVKSLVGLHARSPGEAATATEWQDFVKRELAPYEYPRAVAFLGALPRTETGKLQRFKLRERG